MTDHGIINEKLNEEQDFERDAEDDMDDMEDDVNEADAILDPQARNKIEELLLIALKNMVRINTCILFHLPYCQT